MKLSMSLIAEYLAPYQLECHILEDTQTITGIRFFSEQQSSFSREHVYLGSADGYFQDPKYKNTLLLANGQNQILCRGAAYEDLLNDVLSAFDFYRHLEEQLMILEARHKSFKEIVFWVESVISDPFLVFDLEGTLLACANPERITDMELTENILRKNSLGSNIIGRIFVNEDGVISHDLTAYPQHLHTADTSDIGAVAMYIMQHGERVGFVLLLPSTQQRASTAMYLAPLFVRAFAMSAEFTGKNSLYQSPRSILLRLLNQETVSDTVLDSLFRRLPTTSATIMMVCRSMSIRNYTHRHLLIQEIGQLPEKTICCEYQDCVVIILAEEDQSAILSCIRKEIPKKNMAIGVSMPIYDHHLIPIAYQQAILALNLSTETGIRYCRDLAVSYLLNTLCEKEMAIHLLHPACFLLSKVDTECNSDLYQTLQAFLFCKMNRTEAAEQLHIHLNTLKYRLNRIEELCGIDLKNPKELFYLQLSFAIEEHMQNRRRTTPPLP